MNWVDAMGPRNALAIQVMNHCIKELMPRMKTLDIFLDETKDCDAFGYCLAESKRTFVLEVGQHISDIEFVETICHEMTHVAQYAKGRLAINGKMDYKTQEEYENVWYEKEAYKMEKFLAKTFFENYFKKG